MGKGRKSLPSEQKALKGTIQRCRVKENVPVLKSVSALPKVPTVLNTHGKKIYKTIGKNLLDVGILNEINLIMFTALCREYGIYWEAEENMVKLSDRWEVFTDKEGNKKTVLTALHKLSKEALHNSKMLAVEFGLTPSSITKIVATATQNKPSIEDILK